MVGTSVKKKKAKKLPAEPSSSKSSKPKTAKKIRLPKDEDFDDGVDWSYDNTTEIELREKNSKIGELESRNYILEREKYNFQNELAHLRTDQERKTELLNEYSRELEKLKKEFRNYKKRVREDKDNNRKKANEQLVMGLLDVVDNIDRATSFMKPTEDNKEIIKGVHMINKQLFEVLEREGLEIIDAEGKKFNPHEHESVQRIETKEYPNNTVIEEVQRGYRFNDKVIRPTKVKVSVKLAKLKAKPKPDEKPKEKGKGKPKPEKGKKGKAPPKSKGAEKSKGKPRPEGKRKGKSKPDEKPEGKSKPEGKHKSKSKPERPSGKRTKKTKPMKKSKSD